MQYTESEVTEFITDNDVKFIKMAFCDIFGRQKIIAIQPSLLASAFEGGIPIDASRIMGFEKEADSELFLVPDTSTMSLLPWRPAHGRVVRFFCDIRRSDGTGFDIDCRGILKKAVDIAKLHGIIFEFGARNEFYLFKNDENGNATAIPFDDAGFMDAAPEDKGEDVTPRDLPDTRGYGCHTGKLAPQRRSGAEHHRFSAQLCHSVRRRCHYV